jgi:hypothetical protein
MKIDGVELDGVNEDVLVLPRSKGNLVFKGRAIESFDAFDKECPVPLPPVLLTRKGKKDDLDDSGYKQMLVNHQVKRMSWLTIMTLAPSNIEWDTVNVEDHRTWNNWTDDLSKVLSPGEQRRLLDFVLAVNCLDERKVEAARADFLRGLALEANV